MSAGRVAQRYAKSIIDLARESNALDAIHEDFKTIGSALDSRDFYLLVKSPIILASKKKSIFKAVFGEHLQKLTSSFLDILVGKGRESILPDICTAFHDQYLEITCCCSSLESSGNIGKDNT